MKFIDKRNRLCAVMAEASYRLSCLLEEEICKIAISYGCVSIGIDCDGEDVCCFPPTDSPWPEKEVCECEILRFVECVGWEYVLFMWGSYYEIQPEIPEIAEAQLATEGT